LEIFYCKERRGKGAIMDGSLIVSIINVVLGIIMLIALASYSTWARVFTYLIAVYLIVIGSIVIIAPTTLFAVYLPAPIAFIDIGGIGIINIAVGIIMFIALGSESTLARVFNHVVAVYLIIVGSTVIISYLIPFL
jgi:hypothetical protein